MLMAGTCSRLLNTLKSVPAKEPIASGSQSDSDDDSFMLIYR